MNARMTKFTIEKREQLRKAYEEAVAMGVEAFGFEGNEYLVSYARYLLEYLDERLEPKK